MVMMKLIIKVAIVIIQSNKNNNNNNSNIIIKNNYKNITVTTKILSISNDKKISIEMEVVFNIKYTEI